MRACALTQITRAAALAIDVASLLARLPRVLWLRTVRTVAGLLRTPTLAAARGSHLGTVRICNELSGRGPPPSQPTIFADWAAAALGCGKT